MRVRRYFAFVDLCGFTRFTDTHGDDEAVAVLHAFRAAVRDVASERGVRVAKWLGDGAMFVSTDPHGLVATILDLEAAVEEGPFTLPLRAGLAGGDVILFEGDDYIGSDVNLAARLCDVAEPYETLATTELGDAAPVGTTVTPVGAWSLPGFGRPVDVVRVRAAVTTTA